MEQGLDSMATDTGAKYEPYITNDNLMPVLIQPFVFVALFLTSYFFIRFYMPKSKYSRWKRIKMGLLISFLGQIVEVVTMNCRSENAEENLDRIIIIALPIMFILNIFFGIGYDADKARKSH